ncbi:putative leucine-rich repeat-containing protein DDB_G0290503 [Physella acuta]|uniref:putative leucine-rich repeat-containing protein DDB_G0290503 n=1 Tax=Physella acuta TaxID=109671 RepID=UPI0027DB9734|nr:putative leucine-rich repeat-containing protein DDB_G0290503 [Physella acuta]
MRPRIHLELVTRHKKYLEEKIQVLEPVLEVMKNAVEKSQTWIEDKNDNPPLTYIDLCQELEEATLSLLNASTSIINDNKDYVDVEGYTPSLSQSTPQTTAAEKRDHNESKHQVTKHVQSTAEILSRLEQIETAISSLQDVSRLEQIETAISSLQDVSRLEQIETAISSLQDVNDKSTDDISEIKQWRDNFVTEQSDMGVNIEQLTKKQKQNFKNLRKQMNEQDNKVKELNKETESLREQEFMSNKTLEKLSLNMKEHENNLHKINKELQFHTDKTDSKTQEIKRLSDEIVSLEEDYNKTMANVSTKFEKLQLKHNVMCKLLQQRLMPFDRLIQIFNQNLETREERINKLETMENVMSKLTMDFNVIESRVCKRYACIAQLANPTLVSDRSIISTFSEVREYNGQHFNQTTGKFVSPHDGLYLVCVTLHECGHKLIGVTVMAGGRLCAVIDVKSNRTSAAGSVVVDMKKGEELFFKVYAADPGAMLSSFSSFTIVSL